jgi:hypothetical protein
MMNDFRGHKLFGGSELEMKRFCQRVPVDVFRGIFHVEGIALTVCKWNLGEEAHDRVLLLPGKMAPYLITIPAQRESIFTESPVHRTGKDHRNLCDIQRGHTFPIRSPGDDVNSFHMQQPGDEGTTNEDRQEYGNGAQFLDHDPVSPTPRQ